MANNPILLPHPLTLNSDTPNKKASRAAFSAQHLSNSVQANPVQANPVQAPYLFTQGTPVGPGSKPVSPFVKPSSSGGKRRKHTKRTKRTNRKRRETRRGRK